MRLSLDPGTNGTGWALWIPGELYPYRTGIFVPHHDSWEGKPLELTEMCKSYFAPWQKKFSHVYLEYPAFHQSPGGQVVAKSGALVKLAYLTGYLAGSLREWSGAEIVLIPVAHWKGQLPKTVVESRIRKILGSKICERFKSHVWDAVGIGLYAAGRFH